MESHSSTLDQVGVPFAHAALDDPDSEIRLVTFQTKFSPQISSAGSVWVSQNHYQHMRRCRMLGVTLTSYYQSFSIPVLLM
jgi:hypothetical protein